MKAFVEHRWGPAFAGLLLVVALGGCLQLAVGGGLISPFVIPLPSDVLAEVPSLFTEEGLAHLFALTFGITLLATLLSTVIGVPVGLFLFRQRDFGQAYENWLGAIFSAPVILLYPLFLVVMGRGLHTIVVMSVFVGVTPIILSTYRGFLSVPPVYVRVARSFNMSSHDTFWKVLLPAALPSIFTGIRLALIYAMINAVAIEFLVSIGGLGFLVGDLYDRYNIPGMYAAVGFVIIASMIFFSGLEWLEKWLDPQ
ncbi:ABC transporter permease [Amorphus sp. 3PC139-8]|uniref:ABC transporter permease n=1 Tax=Amorphus sp. 3PC139-8 TaxID=2735676 RepID=UPI00345D8FC6